MPDMYADYGKGQELRELVDQSLQARMDGEDALRYLRKSLTETERIERVIGALAERARRATFEPCKACAKGLPIYALDVNGVMVSVSKRPMAMLGHAVNDAWWVCAYWKATL